MVFNIEAIIYYAILLDSIGANITIWCYSRWYKKNYSKGIFKHFPASKGWATAYLILVLWIGWLLLRLEVLPY